MDENYSDFYTSMILEFAFSLIDYCKDIKKMKELKKTITQSMFFLFFSFKFSHNRLYTNILSTKSSNLYLIDSIYIGIFHIKS